MKKVELYTDGACSGNPGPGGYGCVLIYKGVQKELSGGFIDTTNNRMEMYGILHGLQSIKEPCKVTVYSDSALCVNSINNGWLNNWRKNNWKTSSKDDVKNKDLWLLILVELARHEVTFIKVKGHSDNEINNLCDSLATSEIDKLIVRKKR